MRQTIFYHFHYLSLAILFSVIKNIMKIFIKHMLEFIVLLMEIYQINIIYKKFVRQGMLEKILIM